MLTVLKVLEWPDYIVELLKVMLGIVLNSLTLWTLFSLGLCHPVPVPPGFVVHTCQHQVCAGRFWCHSGYISITAAGRFTSLSGLCALKFWPVFWPLGFKGLSFHKMNFLADLNLVPWFVGCWWMYHKWWRCVLVWCQYSLSQFYYQQQGVLWHIVILAPWLMKTVTYFFKM